MSLYCLIYTSVAKQKMTDENLQTIFNNSHYKYKTLNITGVLLYQDPFFLHLMEGGEYILDEKFNKIAHNPAYHKVSLIYKKPILKRSFLIWTMGLSRKNGEYINSILSFDEFYNSDSFKAQPKEIVDLLKMFRYEMLF